MKKNETLPLSFSFNEAVKKAQREYPDIAQKTTFINMSKPNVKEQIQKWFESHKDGVYLPPEDYDFMAKTDGFFDRDWITGESIVAVPEISDDPYIHNDEHFTFWHEFGHAVTIDTDMIPEEDMDENIFEKCIQASENMADSFAVLQGLKDGFMSTRDILNLAEHRAEEAYDYQSYAHYTTRALQGIVADFADADFISLTPQTVQKIAIEHGRKFSDEAYRTVPKKPAAKPKFLK